MNEQRSQEVPRREGRIWPRGKKGVLWIQWYDHDGRQHRESTRSRDPRVADRILRARLNAKERGERYVPQARRTTLGNLLDGLTEYHETKGTKSLSRLRQCVSRLAEHFGREARAGEVDYRALEAYAKSRRRTAQPATVRLELTTLAQAYKVASRRGLVGNVPAFPTVTVRNVRTATFSEKELAALLDALPGPVRAVVDFASLTGWRLQECLRLRWKAVNFDEQTIRLEADETKAQRARVFPFRTSPRIGALLDQQRQERWRVERERGIDVVNVFTRNGRPVRDLADAWAAACKAAELTDRHFHDLRRFACARMIRAGLAPTEVMALMGHRTLSMHLRYGICDLPMLERAVEKVAALDANVGEVHK